MIRVGQGVDIHRFSDDPARRLILGGCHFPEEPGLLGHSDADAVAHAVADALLGAAGLGDLGQRFPDTDARWLDADSMEILAECVRLVADGRWQIGNVDCSLIGEKPKIAPRREEMIANLTRVVGAPVTVTGRRAEGLGAIGRVEGVMAIAVAVIHRNL